MMSCKSKVLNADDTDAGSFTVPVGVAGSLPFPNFSKPVGVGCFSLNPEGLVYPNTALNGKRSLSFVNPLFKTEALGKDLNEGYENFAWPESEDSIDRVLWFLTDTKQSLQNINFVSWRGALTQLFSTPFEKSDGWKLAVTLHLGVYYLCMFETEEKKAQKLSETERSKRMSYWGHRFEKYISYRKDKPEDKILNIKEAFCQVLVSKLGEFNLLFAGETDAFDESTQKYVEFKTHRRIENDRQWYNFHRYKLLKCWIQSFLVGIEDIIFGFRDDNGIVRQIDTYKTCSIPRLVRETKVQHHRDMWDPAICFSFGSDLLSKIRSIIKEDNPRCAYIFEWNPNSRETRPCSPWISWHKEEGTDLCFLPRWYYEPNRFLATRKRSRAPANDSCCCSNRPACTCHCNDDSECTTTKEKRLGINQQRGV